jgi:tetratricopeptide (TPR) repeat protein
MAERLASLPAHALAHPPARVPAHLPAGTQVAAAGASAGTLENGARCLEQAASLRLGPLGEEAAGLAQAWRVVADHGDSAAAHSALRLIVAAGKRQGQTRALYEELVAGARRVAGRAIASELLLLAARVAEADLGQPALAMARLDELAQRYPQSMLRDDALMQAARLARAGGDFAGALSRYQAVQRARPRSPLLRPYEPSVFARAQYEAALVYLEDLKHLPSALAGLEKVRDGFPQSRLRDDAQLAIARVYEQAGDRAKACAALERLRRDFPESSLVNRKAPEMAARLGCGGARVPTRDGGRQ